MKISLIGAMASGKTTIGKILSEKFDLEFFDTDLLIEQKIQTSIVTFFSNHGEEKFRNLETEILNNLITAKADSIIATGGGIIKRLENRRLLKDNSQVIFLNISITEQLRRTEANKTRPLLMVNDKEERLRSLNKERFHLYVETAHNQIDVDGLSESEILEKIAAYQTNHSFSNMKIRHGS